MCQCLCLLYVSCGKVESVAFPYYFPYYVHFLVISDWMHISSYIGQWVYFYSHKYSWLLFWIQCSYDETLGLFCILFLT